MKLYHVYRLNDADDADQSRRSDDEVLEVMQELSEELDGRTESNPYTPTMLAFVDSPKAFLEYLTKRMSQLSNDGQASRQKYLRDSDGIKVHQLAGIDGTGAIINSDGSFNWDLMKENSPHIRESDWVKLKNLPDVVAFEKASVEKMKEMSANDSFVIEQSEELLKKDEEINSLRTQLQASKEAEVDTNVLNELRSDLEDERQRIADLLEKDNIKIPEMKALTDKLQTRINELEKNSKQISSTEEITQAIEHVLLGKEIALFSGNFVML